MHSEEGSANSFSGYESSLALERSIPCHSPTPEPGNTLLYHSMDFFLDHWVLWPCACQTPCAEYLEAGDEAVSL